VATGLGDCQVMVTTAAPVIAEALVFPGRVSSAPIILFRTLCLLLRLLVSDDLIALRVPAPTRLFASGEEPEHLKPHCSQQVAKAPSPNKPTDLAVEGRVSIARYPRLCLAGHSLQRPCSSRGRRTRIKRAAAVVADVGGYESLV
jgi:hypothetical protein